MMILLSTRGLFSAGTIKATFRSTRPQGAGIDRGLACGLCATILLTTISYRAHCQNTSNLQQLARTKPTRRWHVRNHWLDGRVPTNAGESAAALRYLATQQKLRMRSASAANQPEMPTPLTLAPTGWSPLGPAPLASDGSGIGLQDYNWVSGRATAVAVDPNDPSGNTIYVGGALGGLWKSENAGPLCTDPSTVTWNVAAGQNPQTCASGSGSLTSLIDDQATLSVGAIAIQPQLSNPDPTKSLLLVGTGETNSSTDSYYGLGILRSLDAGNTWTRIALDASKTHSLVGIGFSQMAFSTANTSLVVAAAAGTSEGELEGLENPLTGNLGLYYSTNSGQSWNFALVMEGPSTVTPGSATAVVYNSAANQFFAALRFHGFYSSPDGIHWARLPSQPGNTLTSSSCPAGPTSQACPIYRGVIAVVPGRDGPGAMGEMYVWFTDANDVDQGIWKTTDAGATWAPINDNGITNCGDLLGGCGTEDAAYNLTLAAVPDNPDPNATTGTDLYAGTVNLYKCVTLGTISDCSGTAPNTFVNLTHAYGCPPDFASLANVHPSQHAMDFIQIDNRSQVVMYFTNDGGIYRALDGYSGLTSGTCSVPNQFDSLNQTLGSMTEFVSLAQHPSDPNTMFGGVQGNGTPATATSQTSSSWTNVNSGDGGYTDINPSNPLEWFTSNTGVTIQRCAFGINCHSGDFNGDLVVSSSSLDGDQGPLYTPFMLDPQNPATMIVGTCRVWRGNTQGADFSVLGPNFDTMSTGTCTGNEINTVRSLAAGGPLDGNGFSSVIYAGTDGTGPLAPSPGGGHVWAMSTAADGSTSWADVTGAINPDNYPVSAIAVDPSDKTGDTAFIAIMGFHASHVWKTTTAGQSWTDFTGTTSSLPDAPVNALLLLGNAIYVGSDVGVFLTSTAAPTWTETGQRPVPNGTATGYIPNVPVIALRMFNNGRIKLLRAATYGRGIWQFPFPGTPDFEITFSNPEQTIFAGQTAAFSGTLNAFDNFDSEVTLSCTGNDLPGACAATPNQIAPDTSATSFALNTNGGVGDYNFSVLGSATGFSCTASLTLHIIDFSLASPSPPAISVAAGSTSSAISSELDLAGSFPASGSIVLTCNGATGLSCSFFPSNSIQADSGPASAITFTISAAPGTQTGTSSLNISATSTDAGTKTVSQALNVTVSNAKDYAIAVNAPAAPVPVGPPVKLAGTLTGSNGYSNTVQLSCANGTTAPPANCNVAPQAADAAATGTLFTVTASANVAGIYSFNVQGIGADGAATTRTAPVSLTFYDFAFTADTSAQTVNAGNSATYSLNLTPRGASTFQQTVSYACGTLPALTSCSFNPTQIASGKGAVKVTLTISTTRSHCGP